MRNLYRLAHVVKVASYDMPDQDVYSSGSTRYKVDQHIDSALSRKNAATLAGGVAAGKAMHSLARPLSDTKIPLRQQTFRNIATLGAGLYGAKKVRDFMSRREQKNGRA